MAHYILCKNGKTNRIENEDKINDEVLCLIGFQYTIQYYTPEKVDKKQF